MCSLYEKIQHLCDESNITISKMCSEAKVSRGAITDLKMGRTKTLSSSTLTKIAGFFDTSVDSLLGNEFSKQNEMPILNKKDELDIAKKLDETLELLNNSADGLMFDGEPLDDETKELLRASLKNQLEMTKRLAKQKYTPKKYR